MMQSLRRIFQLAKVLRKCANPKDAGGRVWAKYTTPIIYGTLAVMLFFVSNRFSMYITAVGGEVALLSVVLLLAGTACVLFTLIELVNTLYASSDFAALIVLPYSSLEIAGSRIVNASINKCLLAMAIVMPVCLGYGFAVNANLAFYLVALMGTIIMPLFVIFVIATLVILLMSLVKIFRNRDVLKVVGIVFVLIGVFIYILITNSRSHSSEVGHLIQSGISGSSKFTKFLPVGPLLVDFYRTGNVLSLLGACGLVVATFFILLFVINKFYRKSALAVHNGSLRKNSMAKIIKKIHPHNQSTAILQKELRTIFRTPAFFMNGWVIALLWPVFLFVPALLRVFAGGAGFEMPHFSDETQATFCLIGCVISLIVTVLVTSFSNVAYTAISREGKTFATLKNIPINYKDLLKGKRNAALFVCILGSTSYLLIASIGAIILGILPLWSIVPILLINLAGLIALLDIQLFMGVSNPNLDWDDEAAVGKQSPKTFIAIGIFAVIVLSVFLIANSGVAHPILLTSIVSGAVIVSAIIIDKIILKKATKKVASL